VTLARVGFALAGATALTACGSLPLTRPDPAGPIPIPCCAIGGPPVEITYLGIGGWLIRRGDAAVLTAPLFSTPSITRVGFDTIAPDTARIDRALETLGVDLRDVSAILSGHGHYDHLMDVPYIMERHARAAKLLLNRTSAHQIAPWRLADRLVVVDDSAGDQSSAGRWMRVGDVRVMALKSIHGPQFAGYTLFKGTRDQDLEEIPRLAYEWLDGQTHAFLVDFMDGDRIAFRFYYQDAVTQVPQGLAPDSLLRPDGPDRRRVDVALLVPTTYAEVAWHPEGTLDNLRPRHVLLGHWENFFRSPLEETKPLFMLGFFHFQSKMEHALRALGEGPIGWHIPVAGARFVIP
jgi:L-ascorbate metabolism protein UlaG (beta-lactamase superfamily)